MGLIKRYIHPTLDYVTPDIQPDTDRFTILMNLSQATNTGILEQLSVLFEYTHEIFSELAEEASQTGLRIKSLSERVERLAQDVPLVETATELQSLSNRAISYSNRSEEVACQYLPDYRVPAIIKQYEECLPPPNLGLLDIYAGESCLKKYTNPMFFLETWIEEQEQLYKEAKKKRALRRKGKGRSNTNTQKKVVKQVELSRAKYNAMGKEFDSPALPTNRSETQIQSIESTASSEKSNAAKMKAKKEKRLSRRGTKLEPKKEKKDKEKKKRKPDIKNFPPPSGTAPAPPSGTSPTPSTESASPRKQPESESVSPKGNNIPPPPSVAPPAPPPETVTPKPPVVNPVPVPPPTAPAPPPPSTPVPPPPPTIPQPARSGSLADALAQKSGALVHHETPEKKPEPRSALLASIQQGAQLKKVTPNENRKAENSIIGGFNVAKILARRAAMEFDEDEGSFDEDDWED